MKKRTLIFSIAAIVIVLAAVPFAMAQHMRGRHGHGGMMFGLGRAKAALGLSDQQSADIKQIFTDLRTQNEPLRSSPPTHWASIGGLSVWRRRRREARQTKTRSRREQSPPSNPAMPPHTITSFRST